MKKQRKQKGFTILELLIVVAVIGILVAIGLPKLLRARVTSMEGAGSAAMRSATTAVLAFQAKFTTPSAPATFAALGGATCEAAATIPVPTAACLINDTWATTGINGQYQFTYATSGGDWTLNADPIANSPANRHYFANGETIRYKDGGAAGAGDLPLGQ